MGILREQKMGERLVVDMFPSPLEVIGGSKCFEDVSMNPSSIFLSSLEVNWGCYKPIYI